MEDFLDTDDLAKALKVKPSTIRTWTRKKMIPNYKLSRCVRFKLDEVLEWLGKNVRKEVV